MDRDIKYRIAYDALILLGSLLLLTFITRLWPIILLIILGIFVCIIRMLFLKFKTVEVIVPIEPEPAPPIPETETSIKEKAFGLLQRRVTEELLSKYPNARWIWANQNAQNDFDKNDALGIFLKNAGGHMNAKVRIHNLLFLRLDFVTAHSVVESRPILEPEAEPVIRSGEENSEMVPDMAEHEPEINYSLVAYEWVQAKLLTLNEQYNESIAQGKENLLILSYELPHPDSWFEVCEQLRQNGFDFAEILEDGIQVKLKH